MHEHTNLTGGPRARAAVSIFLAGAFVSACAGDPPLTGTWRDADAMTELPDGTPLSVDATLAMDEGEGESSFDLHLELELTDAGLRDAVDAHGTYERNGSNLTLTITGFDIDPASGNEAHVAEDGSQCIRMMGFGGAGVCFPTPQTNPYFLGEELEITIDQSITEAPVNQTHLYLTPVE